MEISDSQILYISSVICLILILLTFKFSKQVVLINLVVFILYNAILYYNLIYKSEGGSGFVWWFYLIILTVAQILILGIYIGKKYFKK